MKVVVASCWAVLSTSRIVNRVVVTDITKGNFSEDVGVTIGWCEMVWRAQGLIEGFWENCHV